MTSHPVPLPGPVAVVPSTKVVEQLWPHLTPLHLIEEMSRLAFAGALPARMEPDPGRLVVYTDSHVVRLYPTPLGDAYRLGSASPRTFKDEERLVRGAMLLQSVFGWNAYQHVRDIQRGTMSAHWPLLQQAWAQVARPTAPKTALPQHHIAYLDLMDQVIEAGREIELDRQHEVAPLVYRGRRSTLEERHSARPVYSFELVRPAELAAGALVEVADMVGARGRVVRVKGREVVVRFESVIDYSTVPAQGALKTMSSDRVFRAQTEAVNTLRERAGVNPHLLSHLVDRRFAPFTVDPADRPRGRLDPDSQLLAFRRALAVPDMLLILGPPGTGKTTTITEIVAACTARGERVLVTSHTNRAVDNVLEQLPDDIRAIRVGNEDAMTSRARGFMVETHVVALREEILAATESTSSRLRDFAGEWSVARQWLDHLTRSREEAEAAGQEADRHVAALDVIMRRFTDRVTAAELAVAEAAREVARLESTAETWDGRQRSLDRRSHSGLFAPVLRPLAGWASGKAADARHQLLQGRAELAKHQAALETARREAEQLIVADPTAARLMTDRDAARERERKAAAEAAKASSVLRSMVRPFIEDPADLGEAVAFLGCRASLLQEWRAGIGDAEQDLERELVRYAEVVAATCIGTATTKLLADLEFDLVIVDEAGQISTPNLMVPLVRARRSLLVGDHRQLPPFLDDEVKKWGEAHPASEVGELLNMSAFERLYSTVPEQHRVMLTKQRRMPREIGDFISAAFYDGVLQTEHPGGHTDPIFKRPFAMIDTSDRAARQRRETAAHDGRGYVNRLEADIIVRLVAEHARHYRDWAVILPYRAQADLIRAGLADALGDDATDNVGTVDSFQGGERDLIVYGFTRSNEERRVGHLKELRRLNVAVSRAKRQLVLVGDVGTLESAGEPGFRLLMARLLDHLRRTGDLRKSGELPR